MIKNLVIAFLSSTWMLYFAFGLGFLDSTTITVMRSMIISVVPTTEIAKVFCIMEFFKGILNLIGPVIYGPLYASTLKTLPEAFLYFGTAVKFMVLVVGVFVYIELNKRQELKKREYYSHKKDDASNINEDKIEVDTKLHKT